MRDADANNFRFASNFVSQRVSAVQNDIASLNADMAKVVTGEKSTFDPKTGTRNAFLRGLSGRLDLTIARFNAFRTDPQLVQFRNNFAKRSEQTIFDDDRGGRFRCPDSQLQMALRGVVRAIDGLPELDRPPVAAVEGSEAIVEAFRRLTTTTFGLLTLKLPPSPDELRFLQHKAVQSVQNAPSGDLALHQKAGLGERDYIPLFVAIFVDLCILLVSINRPVNRLQGFINTARDARDAQMHEVLNRFHQVHKGERSQRLDIFHDAMFDWNGDHYVAVPLDLRTISEDDEDKKKVTQARYLSTIMATLEEAKLVKRSLLVGAKTARRKLMELSSPFTESPSFRVYRFTNGAWPAIVLDDILGASDKLIAEQTAEAHRQAVHDLFRPQSTPRREPDWSNLPRPEFPCWMPGEKKTSQRKAPRHEGDFMPSRNSGSADIVHDGDAHGASGTATGTLTPNVNAFSGRSGEAAVAGAKPESMPEPKQRPDPHPAMPAGADSYSKGSSDRNGLPSHSRNGSRPNAEFLQTFESEGIDGNQRQLPSDPSGAVDGKTSLATRIVLAGQTPRAGGNGGMDDIIPLTDRLAKFGAAADETDTAASEWKNVGDLVDDRTEAMAAGTMPPEALASKVNESLTKSKTVQDTIPEPPKSRDRQFLVAVSERDIVSAERTENMRSGSREILKGSGQAKLGVMSHREAKRAARNKKFRSWLGGRLDKRANEDPGPGWHQEEIDHKKIAQRFRPLKPISIDKSRNGKPRE